MIGITWHGPRDPAAELATVRDCEHPACEALRNQPSSVVVTPLSNVVQIDAEELKHFADKGPDIMAQRMEQLREQIRSEDQRRHQGQGWTVGTIISNPARPPFIEARVELTPEDAAAVRHDQHVMSLGYTLSGARGKIADDEFRQHSIRANYFALMPDGSLETVLDGRVVYRETDLVKHWDFRRQQRVNRKRRAARKSKRGWS
jgi:hypothetical protein